MAIKRRPSFDPKSFLAKVGEGRSIGNYRKDQIVFSQGDPADSVFFIQKGKVKVAVVSEQGKEAVVAILGANDFFGEACLAGQARRIATVAAMAHSVIVRLEKAAIIRVIHIEPAFAEMFIAHLLDRTIRVALRTLTCPTGRAWPAPAYRNHRRIRQKHEKRHVFAGSPDVTSSVITLKPASVHGPNDVTIATSVASRPRAIKMRPMRGLLWRASNVYQRPPR